MKHWIRIGLMSAMCAVVAMGAMPAFAATSVYPDGADGGDNELDGDGIYNPARQLDYDFLLSVFDEFLPVLLPTWNTGGTPLYTTVTHQVSPFLYGQDNNANSIKDNDHMDALAAVYNGGATAATGVAGADIAAIQAAFNNNRTAVQNREIVFPKVTVTAFGFLTINLTNVASGFSQTVAGNAIAVPSLWTAKEVITTADPTERGLLAEGGDMLEVVLRDVLAAQMTLCPGTGSTEIAYIQSFMSVFITNFLRTQLPAILAGIGTVTTNAGNNYNTLDIDVNVDAGGTLGVIRVRIAGSNQGSQHMQQAVAFFKNSFTPTLITTTWTGNGFNGGAVPAPNAWHDGVAGGADWPLPNFICLSGAGSLAATGNLNRAGNTNVVSYTGAAGAGQRQNWMQAEGITIKPIQFVGFPSTIAGFAGSTLTIGEPTTYTFAGGDGTTKAYDWETVDTEGAPVTVTNYKYTVPPLGGTTSNATYVFNPVAIGDTGKKISVQVADDTWTRTVPRMSLSITDPPPTVSSVAVQSAQVIRVTFSEALGTGATTLTNYVVSGTGKGSFANNPSSIALVSSGVYDLTWNSPQEMFNGGNITVTVSNVQDTSSITIGAPNSGSCTGCAIGTAPTISSLVSQNAGPTNAASIDYLATFSESVTGAVTGNFSVGLVSGTASGTISGIAGTGTTRTVTMGTIAGTGTLRVNLSTTSPIVDLAGNPLSGTLDGTNSVVDRDAPAVPTVDLDAGSDSGPSSTDNYTNDNTPTLSGTTEAGATVNVTSSIAGAIGTTTADGLGVWTVTTPTLADGVHNITAIATDALGNASAASTALPVTVDTVAPALPSVPDLLAASDSGTSNTDNITNLTTLNFEGTREANTSVSMTSTQGATFTVAALGSGTWSISGSSMAANVTHNVRANASDLAGNSSGDTGVLGVQIDTAAPAVATRNPTASATVGALPNVEVTYTESVTGVAAGTLTVNASAATAVTGSGVGPYTFSSYAVPADGTVNVSLLAGAVVDVAGNSPALDTWTYTKSTAFPTVSWSATGVVDGGLSNGTPVVQLTATFSEGVTGFVATDVTRVNCTINTFQTLSATQYRFNVSPSGQGTVQLTINANVCQAVAAPAGRNNLASPTFSYTFDSVKPNVLSIVPVTSDPTNANTVIYTVIFDGAVTDFDDLADITYFPDGTLANTGVNYIQNTASNYTIEFTGVSGDGTLTPFIPGGAARDAANNTNNQGFGFAIVVDNTAPVLTADVLVTTDSTPELTGTVDEADLPVSVTVNGQANSATVSGNDWTLDDNTLLALPDAVYDVQLSATDLAGNTGADSTTGELTVDANGPTITLTGLALVSVNCGDGYAEEGYTASDDLDGDVTIDVIVSDTIAFDTPPGTYVIEYEVTDSGGNVGTATRTVEVLDNCALAVTPVGPTSFLEEGGASITLEVSVTGNVGGYTIQWYRVRGSNAPEAVGDDDETLELVGLDRFDDAIYYCEVSDAVTTVESTTFDVVVNILLPVAGALGMGLMAAASAISGALVLRRRKK